MINLKELAENQIFVGDKQVNKIYLNNTVVYPQTTPDFINLTTFHSLVPNTATEISFLFASDNPDFTDYQKIGYCDDNNCIEVWNNGTKYILINPINNYIYAPLSCYNFFADYTTLRYCDLSNFDTAYVTDMSDMFVNCYNLTSLDLSNFDTANVTDMSTMFNACESLTSLDLSNFNTANVTDMSSMFWGCRRLTSLNLSSFDTANVTDMYYMFCDCSSLTTITSKTFLLTALRDSSDMFYDCLAIVGGNGTIYNSAHITAEYARVDGENGLPGYFTAPAADKLQKYSLKRRECLFSRLFFVL